MDLLLNRLIANAAHADANGNGLLSRQEIAAEATKAGENNDLDKYNFWNSLASQRISLDLNHEPEQDQVSLHTADLAWQAKAQQQQLGQNLIQASVLKALTQYNAPAQQAASPFANPNVPVQVSPLLAYLLQARLQFLTQQA